MLSAPIPALERRSRLVSRQPRSARRRSARVLSRFAVLLAFDVAAYAVARLIARGVVASPLTFGDGVTRALGPLAPPGAPGSLVFPITLFVALLVTASYARHRSPIVVVRILAAVALAAAATAVTLATLVGVRAAAVHAAPFAGICFLALVAGRVFAELFARKVWPRKRALLPAVALTSGRVPSTAPAASWGDYTIVEELRFAGEGSQDLPGMISRLHELAETHSAEAVVTTEDIPHDRLVPLADEALDLGYRIIYPARAVAMEGVRPRILWHKGEPFFEVSAPMLRTSALLTKRITDVLGAGVLLLFAAPVMAAAAAAIKLDSRGPVFFNQDRAGIGGRRFRMLKFRTMAEGADDMKQELAHLNRSGDVRLFKIPADPRVTRVGRILRRWSIDELPQLINVLRGDMSLVGPRPLFEEDFAAYEDRHFRRLDTKPGITGLWQVSGRSDLVDFEDVIFLDRQYIEQWSIWLDLSILARTIPAVLRRHGAY